MSSPNQPQQGGYYPNTGAPPQYAQAQPMSGIATGVPVTQGVPVAVPVSNYNGQPQYAVQAQPAWAQPAYAQAVPAYNAPPQYNAQQYNAQQYNAQVGQHHAAIPVATAVGSPQGQPHAFQTQVGPTATGDGAFSDGLFDCCNDSNTMFSSLFCPWYPWAKAREESGILPFSTAVGWYLLPWAVALVLSGLVMMGPNFNFSMHTLMILQGFRFLAAVVMATLTYYYRSRLRAVYRMVPDQLSDLVAALCCTCCAIAQEARHTKRFPRRTGYAA